MNPAMLLFATTFVMLAGFLVATDPLVEALVLVAAMGLAICGLMWLVRRRG